MRTPSGARQNRSSCGGAAIGIPRRASSRSACCTRWMVPTAAPHIGRHRRVRRHGATALRYPAHPTESEGRMQLVNWWKVVVLQRYAQFMGRASRAEYWWFFLANLIVLAVLGVLSRASTVFAILYLVYGLAVLIPGIAVAVRR